MSQSLSRRSLLKCAGSGAVSLAAALLTALPEVEVLVSTENRDPYTYL